MKRVISILMLGCLLSLPFSYLSVNAETRINSNPITSEEPVITINSPGDDDTTDIK